MVVETGGVVTVPGLGDGLGNVEGDEGVVAGLGRIVPVVLEDGCSLIRPDCAESLLAGTKNTMKTSADNKRM